MLFLTLSKQQEYSTQNQIHHNTPKCNLHGQIDGKARGGFITLEGVDLENVWSEDL